MKTKPEQVQALVNQAILVFAGHPADLQGAALADLLAIWLVGHVVTGNPRATRKMRRALLDMHVGVVRQLIPVNEEKVKP